jgi:hypothetical protein
MLIVDVFVNHEFSLKEIIVKIPHVLRISQSD